MVIYLKKKKLFSLHITWFDKADVLPLIQKAIPSAIQQSIPAVSTTFLTALVKDKDSSSTNVTSNENTTATISEVAIRLSVFP